MVCIVNPTEVKAFVMDEFEQSKLKPAQSVKEYAIYLEGLLRTAMPEITDETVSVLVRRQLINSVGDGWKNRLREDNVQTIDGLVNKISALQLANGAQTRSGTDLVRRNKSVNFSGRCNKCGLRGHKALDCRTRCRKCSKTGHIAKNCESGPTEIRNNEKYDRNGDNKNRKPFVRRMSGLPPMIMVEINGKQIMGIVDTGSDKSIIRADVASALGLKLRFLEPSEPIRVANGEPLRTEGAISVVVGIGSIELEHKLLISDSITDDFLIGWDLLKRSELMINCGTEKVSQSGREIGIEPITMGRLEIEQSELGFYKVRRAVEDQFEAGILVEPECTEHGIEMVPMLVAPGEPICILVSNYSDQKVLIDENRALLKMEPVLVTKNPKDQRIGCNLSENNDFQIDRSGSG